MSVGRRMTLSEFYRGEAQRCLRRAGASRQAERAKKWHDLADEYLRLALLTDGTEATEHTPMHGVMREQAVQQQQSRQAKK